MEILLIILLLIQIIFMGIEIYYYRKTFNGVKRNIVQVKDYQNKNNYKRFIGRDFRR